MWYCYVVGFIRLARVTINSLNLVSVLISLFQKLQQTDRHMQSRTDAPDMIPIKNLLMVNQTVVIASMAASVT